MTRSKFEQSFSTAQHVKNVSEPLALDNILQHIGNTPLVRVSKLAKKYGIECELYVKCEMFNASGSIKDRIALRMIEEAERKGILKPGYSTIIEPTSGNTGIALALAGAVKGYRVIIVLPQKMSMEKVNVLKALGAEIIRTPSQAAWDSPDSLFGVSRRLKNEIEGAVILDQYGNSCNPLAHYDGTAEEILNALDNKVDMFVSSTGTGGTITGCAMKLKERCPNIRIVGADPIGSVMAQPDCLNSVKKPYLIEGIGYDFVPDVCDQNVVDEWVKTDDKESFTVARDIIKEEGILCGGSAGSVMVAALQKAKSLKKGQRCVVILADSIRNYMSKFLMDDWMDFHGFIDNPKKMEWNGLTVRDLDLKSAHTVNEKESLRDVAEKMNSYQVDHIAVVDDENNTFIGMVMLDELFSNIHQGDLLFSDSVSSLLSKPDMENENYRVFLMDTPLSKVADVVSRKKMAVIVEDDKVFTISRKELLAALLLRK